MTNPPKLLTLTLAVVVTMLFAGCDHTRRIRQSVTLEFSVTSEDDLFPCESVSIRENASMSAVDKKREAINPGRFESLYPWYGPVKIDNSQQASFTIEEVMIVAVDDKTPPRAQHPFTGKSFLVKLEGCGNEQPITEVVLVKGEVAVGARYSVKVVDVSDAVYLNVR